MTAKVIPLSGDHIPDGAPSVSKWVKITVGATEGEIRTLDDTTATIFDVITLPQYAWIQDVGWRVQTAFTAGVDLQLGDTNNLLGWAEVADIAATVASTNITSANKILYYNSASSDAVTTAPAFAGFGIICDTGATTIQISSTATEAATGLLEVYVKYNMVQVQVSTEPDAL